MNQNILELLKIRNSLKYYDEYKSIKNKITTECRITKDKWLEVNYKEIETDLVTNNTDNAYNKVKRLNYMSKTKSIIVKNKTGIILF